MSELGVCLSNGSPLWHYKFNNDLDVPIRYPDSVGYVHLYEQSDACIWSGSNLADWLSNKYSVEEKAKIIALYRISTFKQAIISDIQTGKK